jgi:undecaprenyl diphosphate synthase
MNTAALPRHIAIVMDGNGRWAKQRHLPRVAGHRAGVDTVRDIIAACVKKNIEVLSLFAFSSENWQRPPSEVSFLMDLFLTALEREAVKLHKQNIRLTIIGDRQRFNEKLQQQINHTEKLTAMNTGLKLVVAVNYGGRWDICEAVKKLAQAVEQGQLTSAAITPELIDQTISLNDLPPPDLFIRTSGEQRISNFMLWQLAYTELYFTDTLWPDFNAQELDKALHYFATRERRFGYTGEQLNSLTENDVSS